MFGFNIIETGIGLILVFLLMSLLCSALREALESVLKQRAYDLERGIRSLLDDPEGEGLAKDLYEHPLVYGLYNGEYAPRRPRTRLERWFPSGGSLPSYIPNAAFARALLDLEEQGRVQSVRMRAMLRALGRGTNNDVARLRANIEEWFEAGGQRIGGWYKRRTQWILFAIGLIAAVALNVDSLAIAGALHQRADLRSAVVATAERFSEAPPAALQQTGAPPADAGARADQAYQAYRSNLNELHALAAQGLPMGWRNAARPAPFVIEGTTWRPNIIKFAWWRDHGVAMITGWLLTALAVTLGAPFWFDLLNRFMAIRSTLRPKPREAEEQEPAPARPAPRMLPVPEEALAHVQRPIEQEAPPDDAVPVAAGAFEGVEWRTGDDPQAGVL